MKRSKSRDSQIEVAKVDVEVEKHTPDSVEEADADSLAGQESEAYGNRIHCCSFTSWTATSRI